MSLAPERRCHDRTAERNTHGPVEGPCPYPAANRLCTVGAVIGGDRSRLPDDAAGGSAGPAACALLGRFVRQDPDRKGVFGPEIPVQREGDAEILLHPVD